MPPYDASSCGLEYLIDLNRYTYVYPGGWWWTVRFAEVRTSPGRPFGVKYSLTLHHPGSMRMMGYDNSHKVKGLKQTSRAFDHIHWRNDILPYEYRSPMDLLRDFFADADRLLKEEGVL